MGRNRDCIPTVEYDCIVSLRRTFVNEENTTDSSVVFLVFLYTLHKTHSLSITFIQAEMALLSTGTQLLAPEPPFSMIATNASG